MRASVSTTPFCSRMSIFPQIDNSARISVLRNIENAATSRPLSKWDTVYIISLNRMSDNLFLSAW